MQTEVGHWVRDQLIDVAKRRGTVTYGELKSVANLTHPPNVMGRLLDVISEDFHHRGEPSLAPLVNAGTQEVGSDYDGDPVGDRQRAHHYWS